MRKINILDLDNITINKLVRIQGTEFDRSRKLSDADVKLIRKLFNKKKMSISELAEQFNVSRCAIRYHIDNNFNEKMKNNYYIYGDYHKYRNMKKEAKERGQYKRDLIQNNQLKEKIVLEAR